MSALRIHLFGGTRVAHGGNPDICLPPVLRILLAYLLVERERSHPRETLAGLFWGGHPEERARACLNTALWRLRAVLEPPGTLRGTYLISTAAGDIGFNSHADHWLDIAVFEREAVRIATRSVESIGTADAAMLEDVIGLYKGDLLDGCFDDWAIRERERLRRMLLGALEHLMRYHRYRDSPERSIAYGQELLRRDVLREDVHREIMEVYLEAGQRTRAMQQYAACREALDRELGIPPSGPTRAVYSRLVGETAPAARPGSSPDVRGDLAGAAQYLGEAVERMRAAHAAFVRALDRIDAAPTPAVTLRALNGSGERAETAP